jgi:hypothetical protein
MTLLINTTYFSSPSNKFQISNNNFLSAGYSENELF